jgi:hypothetical protein
VRYLPERSVTSAIDALPCQQREIVRQMLNASSHPRGTAKAKGIRYSQAWMYQCILLKIRSFKLYCLMRRHQLLPLPSPSTIHKYIRKLKPSFGFQPPTFKVLKEKASGMPERARRGT